MSTKTLRKRLALAVVAAMGFGLLSVAPANATAGGALAIAVNTGTLDDGVALAASKYTKNEVRATGQISAFSVEAASSVALKVTAVGGTFTVDDDYKVDITGYGLVVAVTAFAATASGASDTLTAFTAPSIPGTYTVNVTLAKDGTFASATDLVTSVAMTVTAPSGVSPTLSTAYITAGNAGTAADVDTNDYTASASAALAAANRGSILLTMKNTSGAAMTTGNTLTAQITSGPGYLVATTTDLPTADQCSATPLYSATVGRAVSAFALDAINNIIICADGTPGVAKISLSVTNQLVTTAWTTKEFTFFGTVRTLSIDTTNYTIGAAGGDETGAAVSARTATGEVTNAGALTAGTTTPAFIIAAKDAAGQLATAASAPTLKSGNEAVIASASCALDDGQSAYSSGEGFGLYNCSFTTTATAKSGDKATLTLRISDPLGVSGIDYLTTTIAVTVGGTRYKETVAFDKTSYNPGEAMVITRTATDLSGNPVADGSSAPAVVFNKSIGGTAPAAGFYVGGKLVTSSTKPGVFAPTASGVFEARITGYNSALTTSAIVATSTVGNDAATVASEAAADAAAEATDAANAATDAANAAAEAADAATAAAQDAADAVAALSAQVATLVSGLKAQLTALTNLVIKIQKKVKA